MRRKAELRHVSAGVSDVVYTTRAFESAVVMMVVPMPATFGVLRRFKVAHWDFLRLLFAHIIFPH
jgi:hypothetical protein